MKGTIKIDLDSNVTKFQTKIIKNLQLWCFSKDAIISFCKDYKLKFKDYEFLDFENKFKNISIKNVPEIKKIKNSELSNYGKNLIENELSNFVFVLNMFDFEVWLVEFLNIIFSGDHKILLRYLKPEETPINLSLMIQSSNIDELWQEITDRYLLNKFYGRKEEILKNLLSVCNIKIDKKFEKVIGEINENFLCRNIIVHNKNKVNKEYLNKAGKYTKFKNIGEIAKISEKYLFDQGDNLLFFMNEVRKKIKSS